MIGNIKDQSPELKTIRTRIMGSTFWTGWYLCGYDRFSFVLHWAMAKWVDQNVDSGVQRLLVMIPRDYYKTSLLGVANVVRYLITHPNHSVLYVMHKHSIAAEKMSEVQSAFESAAMKRYFPQFYVEKDHRAKYKWGSGTFTIPRDNPRGAPSVTCGGIVTGSVGGHYDYIIWDDIIKGDDEDATSQVRAAMAKARRLTFLWKNRRESKWLILGTLWEGGFYEDILTRPNFSKLVLGCYVDDRFKRLLEETNTPIPREGKYIGKLLKENVEDPWGDGMPVFPEQETMESLEEAKIDAGPDFVTQMLNIPSTDSKRRFRKSEAPYYRGEYNSEGKLKSCIVDEVEYPISAMNVYLTMDPTGGMSKTADKAGIVVCGYMRNFGMAFVLDYWKGVEDPKKQIELTLQYADKWQVKAISPEWNAYQVTYSFWLNDLMRKRKKRYVIDPFKRGAKSKAALIYDSIYPYWKNRQLFFNESGSDGIIDELTSITIRNGVIIGESPALADALAFQRRFWNRRYRVGDVDDDTIKTEERGASVIKKVVKYGLKLSKFDNWLNI